MFEKCRNWLYFKLKEGFWFPYFRAFIKKAYERCSFGHRFKIWLKRSPQYNQDNKGIRGASELYQLSSLVIALCWISLIKLPVAPLSNSLVRSFFGLLIGGYRILEILFFTLHWIFAASRDERLHSVPRSLAGFILNIIEVSLYTSIIFILIDCEQSANSQWSVVYQNIAASFRLTLAAPATSLLCRIIAHLQLITAGILFSIAVASLVGGVLRDEKSSDDGAA